MSGVSKCVSRVDKEECQYDAIGGLWNSADFVADVSRVRREAGSCLFAEKSLFVNLDDLYAVSKPALRFERPTTPFLEIHVTKTFKPLDSVRHCARQQALVAKDVAAGAVAAVADFNGVSLYDTSVEYSFFVREPERRVHFGSLESDDWLSKENEGFTADTIRLCQSIARASSAARPLDVQAEEMAIELTDLALSETEPRQLSHHPSEWKCEDCGKMKNLWLNLSDGYVGCGRRQYGVEDSGCHGGLQGAAIRHFEQNPSFHVAVKLGTISPVTADVYSYSLDSPVDDPQLALHLKRLGLDRSKLAQTSQSTAELAVEQNQRLMCGLPDAQDARLHRVFGEGQIGIMNIGNSCYMASVIQLLRVVFDGEPRQLPCAKDDDYFDTLSKCFESETFPRDSGRLAKDLIFQLYRLMYPLSKSGRCGNYRDAYDARRSVVASELPSEVAGTIPLDDPDFLPGIPRPSLLKRLVGSYNREFATNFQQDAEEFFQLLFSRLCEAQVSRFGQSSLQRLLEVPIMTKTALKGNRRRLVKSRAPLLSLRLPQSLSKESPVELRELLKLWTECNDGGQDEKQASRGLLSFPEFLMLHIQRLTVDDSYAPIKLSDKVSLPESLDLDFCRAPELLDGEFAAEGASLDSQVVEELKVFGFTRSQMEAAAQALPACQHNTEMVTEWILSHQDVNMTAEEAVDAEKLSMLMALGMDSALAEVALTKTHGDVEAAANLLLTDPESLVVPSVAAADIAEGQTKQTEYQLRGAIIHIGANAHCGHYVAYVKKNQQWCLYNDDVVTAVEGLPDLTAAYLCLYELMV